MAEEPHNTTVEPQIWPHSTIHNTWAVLAVAAVLAVPVNHEDTSKGGEKHRESTETNPTHKDTKTEEGKGGQRDQNTVPKPQPQPQTNK